MPDAIEVGHLVEMLSKMSTDELALVESALSAERLERLLARDRLVKTVRKSVLVLPNEINSEEVTAPA